MHPELGAPSMMVLQTIIRMGPITATGVGGVLDIDKSVVSRQVSKLRSLGLVETREAESDRRVALLTASELAQRTVEGLHARTAAEYRARFEGWSDDDLVQLQQQLHRFNLSNEDLRGEGPARRCARETRGE